MPAEWIDKETNKERESEFQRKFNVSRKNVVSANIYKSAFSIQTSWENMQKQLVKEGIIALENWFSQL